MLDVLRFVFSDFLHFVGTLVLICAVLEGIEGIVAAWRKREQL